MQHYWSLGESDRQLYATQVIADRIVRGRIIDTKTLPSWVPRSLVNIIRKCCAQAPQSRFASAADLAARLNNLRGNLPDWRIADFPILYRNGRRYRISPNGGGFKIEKSINDGPWRRERSHLPATVKEAVAIAEAL